MYLRNTGNARATKGAMTAGQMVATRVGMTRMAGAAAAVPIAGPDDLLAGPLHQEGAPVGVGARRKVAKKATPDLDLGWSIAKEYYKVLIQKWRHQTYTGMSSKH